MNCLEFERLLDEGEPARLPAPARAHALDCARCARSLARARSLERSLERHFAAALAPGEQLPAAFAERVMARVQRGEARGVRWLTLPDALPWWVRAAAEPGVGLAAVVAALLLWRGDVLIAVARAWTPGLALAPVRIAGLLDAVGIGRLVQVLASVFVPAPGTSWSVTTAVLLGVAPVLALTAVAMWRLGERLVGPPGAAVLKP